ncbi:MAG: S-adenosylmethionine:tRNA ribosyltransferase-isomerase [Candidatus Sumerlaeota bacterium]|nr:S-adenosylmethionine:tRNA ribosyltransferase-isomerase [Candidatus Sumerlaeota bacterium]
MPYSEPTSHYDYELPEELIADRPAERRDGSRLLVVPPGQGAPLEHRAFSDLPEYLRAGDVLVLNDSRVIPARLYGKRLPGGGQCEALLLEPCSPTGDGVERWTALVRPGKKLKPGTRIVFGEGFEAVVEEELGGGEKRVRFACDGTLAEALDRHGHMPLPPYILARRGEKGSRPEDRERYQTVYARADGSVAAPTAGLHFTPELLAELQARGVEIARVTLHVGAGTFQPITAEDIGEHVLHMEHYTVPEAAAETVNRAKAEGRRVVAVGTTSVRTLESAAGADSVVRAGVASTALMIAPGYRFRVVDALVTNFHLPRSSLLCLVAALMGRERLLAVYAEAIGRGYRFYSYGDSMFVGGCEGS